jgi:carbonic anhydrase
LGLATGRLAVHGWVFDIETGSMFALDSQTHCFVPLSNLPHACAERTERPDCVS